MLIIYTILAALFILDMSVVFAAALYKLCERMDDVK